MGLYTPRERLEKNVLPNFFTYATKEFSQDAFLCWALEWTNIKGYQMCEFAYLLIERFIEKSVYKNKINPLEIRKVEIIRQYKNIDVLILAKLLNGLVLPIIIEDKIDTSEHSGQLERYRKIITEEYTDFPEPICIFYKTGYFFEPFSQIEKQGYLVFDKAVMIEIMEVFKDIKMPIIFCDYYAHLFSKQKHENEIKLAFDRAIQHSDITLLTKTLGIDFSQWEFMKRLTQNIEVNAHMNLGRGTNPSGSPFTQYFIDDSFSRNKDEAFYREAFYRIDSNKNGYYLSLRQYLVYDSEDFIDEMDESELSKLFDAKMNQRTLYRDSFEKAVREINKDIPIYVSNRGAYESEVGRFQLDSIETLVWLKDNLVAVTNRFLELVKNAND